MTSTDDTTSVNSFAGKGVFPPRYAFTLLIPFRNLFLSPKKLLQRLEMKEDFDVLEIGPGPGYFSTHVARELRRGRLVLLDIQREMLEMAKKRLEKRGIANVLYVVTDGLRFALADNSFDRIFMVTVLGEVAHKDEYLREISRTLRSDGILSISELAGDPDKITIEEMQSLVCQHGFEVSRIFGNRRNYTVNFRKKSAG